VAQVTRGFESHPFRQNIVRDYLPMFGNVHKITDFSTFTVRECLYMSANVGYHRPQKHGQERGHTCSP
jgi:hypothetical protein